ncbi:putative Mpv17-like protein 2 [Hypsibius exemplaris]|uniref:Mpv17-like protein 2 n=1 Tax=Hypsibius exemplaris TaxID=2072580 RepID=A0A1W0WVL2_HYPEX|nr:putative Mpv17-like protein 2 [Hypsibius exemplaris]
MAAAGASVGIYCHFLYRCLDRVLPGRDVRTLTKKVLLDNLSAPLQFAIFFGVLSRVEGRSFREYFQELRHKGLHLYLASSCIYAPAQFINFRFLRPQFRVLYVSVLNLCFDTYTSYVAHTTTYQHNGHGPLETPDTPARNDLIDG